MSVEITKAANVLETGVPTPEQLEKINRQAKTPLTAEEVYIFAVRLCDTLPDRDNEQFSPEALDALAPMFVGKTGILDHAWQAGGQVARIFDTALQHESGVCWLKGWAYMLREEKTESFIREIEGGIKREVSVGCAVGKRTCSICGEDYGFCGHEKGELYGGDLCTAILSEPLDAYEFSFVAVPAQRDAGVVKAAGGEDALKELRKQAALGRQYRKQIQTDVVRLGLILDMGPTEALWQKLTSALPTEDLLALRDAFAAKEAALFPPVPQLTGYRDAVRTDDGAFMI